MDVTASNRDCFLLASIQRSGTGPLDYNVLSAIVQQPCADDWDSSYAELLAMHKLISTQSAEGSHPQARLAAQVRAHVSQVLQRATLDEPQSRMPLSEAEIASRSAFLERVQENLVKALDTYVQGVASLRGLDLSKVLIFRQPRDMSSQLSKLARLCKHEIIPGVPSVFDSGIRTTRVVCPTCTVRSQAQNRARHSHVIATDLLEHLAQGTLLALTFVSVPAIKTDPPDVAPMPSVETCIFLKTAANPRGGSYDGLDGTALAFSAALGPFVTWGHQNSTELSKLFSSRSETVNADMSRALAYVSNTVDSQVIEGTIFSGSLVLPVSEVDVLRLCHVAETLGISFGLTGTLEQYGRFIKQMDSV